MEKRVTLRDIAAESGFHYTSVSLALRKDPRLPEKTREKIEKVARRMGYCPDPMVNALSSYRTAIRKPKYHATLAWLMNAPEAEPVFENFFRHFHSGAKMKAAQLGYTLEDFYFREAGMTPERFSRILQARGIRGIVVAPQPIGEMEKRISLDWERFSAVNLSASLVWPRLHLVTNNHFASAQLTFRKLRDLGYRRIGMIVSERSNSRMRGAWWGGICSEMAYIPRKERIDPLMLPWHASSCLWKDWMNKNRLDALIVETSERGDFFLKGSGLRAPKDIGVACLYLEPNEKRFAGINQNDSTIGAAAVDLLVHLLHTNEYGVPPIHRHLEIEGDWSDGATVRRK